MHVNLLQKSYKDKWCWKLSGTLAKKERGGAKFESHHKQYTNKNKNQEKFSLRENSIYSNNQYSIFFLMSRQGPVLIYRLQTK
jgi:hypothetical protein